MRKRVTRRSAEARGGVGAGCSGWVAWVGAVGAVLALVLVGARGVKARRTQECRGQVGFDCGGIDGDAWRKRTPYAGM